MQRQRRRIRHAALPVVLVLAAGAAADLGYTRLTSGTATSSTALVEGVVVPSSSTTTATSRLSADRACPGAAPILDRSGLWTVPSSGPAVKLYHGGDDGTLSNVTQSPDGHRFAFFVTHDDSDSGDLMVADLQGTRLVSHEKPGTVSWTPDGQQLAVVSQVGPGDESSIPTRLTVVGLDGRHMTIWEQPSTTRIAAVVPHPDGDHLLFVSHNSASSRYDDATLARIRPDGSGYAELASNLSYLTPLLPAPDRRSVAAVAGGQRVTIDLASGAQHVVAASPAGTAAHGYPNLVDSAVSWSPDSRWLAYLWGGGTSGATITLYPLADLTARPIEFTLPGHTGESYRGVTFSADSRQAIAVQGETDDPELAAIDLPSGSRHVLARRSWHLLPLGTNQIVVALNGVDDGPTVVCRMGTDGSEPTPLLRFTGEVLRDFGTGDEPMIRSSQGLRWRTGDSEKSGVIYVVLP